MRVLEKARDRFPVSPYIVKETREISRAGREYAKQGIVSDSGDDSVSGLLLDHSHSHLAAPRRRANLVGSGNYSGHTCCQTFSVEIHRSLTVYQQPVAAEYDYCLDAGLLANSDGEVADGRHQCSIK
jgi:hypothetical protein